MQPAARRSAVEDERAATSQPDVVAAIRAEIERDGRVTFDRFMELALYHPQHGYYVRRRDRATRAGDFLSAPEMHPLFAAVLARQVDEMWQLMGRPAEFTLRDVGAGSGALGEQVRQALIADGSALAGAFRYEPVEAHGALGDPIVGCIVANELLDALPVHRVALHDGRLHEVYVRWRDGWFAEELGDPSTRELARYLERENVVLVGGQQAEINLRAPALVADLARRLERGFLLIVDYGYPAAELYGPRHAAGTLLGYRAHRVSDHPYTAVGEQDLTAHVDLTAVESAARDAGLELVGRTTQAEFFVGMGLGELLDRIGRDRSGTARAYIDARAAAVRFLDPRHMGNFAVLAFSRDVAEAALRGFSYRSPAGVAGAT